MGRVEREDHDWPAGDPAQLTGGGDPVEPVVIAQHCHRGFE
jgi:hypothetical protein